VIESGSVATGFINSALSTMGAYGGSDTDRPRAFLNYILFDQNFTYLSSGFDRIDASAGFSTGNPGSVSWDQMSLLDIPITESGYAFIWLSNETENADVWFDDLQIVHTESSIIQADDYYPFGLSMASSYQRVDALNNAFKYNGKELQSDLDLNWYDYGARMYNPALGRWNAIDLYTEIYEENSPYSFGGNNPISATDYEGKLIVYVNGFRPTAYAIYLAKQARSLERLPAPHEHIGENWFYSDTFDYWGEFNESWSFPDKQRFYVDGSNYPESTAGDRFGKGEVEGRILAQKIKSGEIKLEDGETIKLIGHSMGAAHAVGMAKGC
jgi:RHS repeat-associated protein